LGKNAKRQDGVQEEMKKAKNQQEGKAEVTQEQKDYKGEHKEARNEVRKKEAKLKLKPIAEFTRTRSKTADTNRIYKLYSLLFIIRSERQYKQNNKLKNQKYDNPSSYHKLLYSQKAKKTLKKKEIGLADQFYINPIKSYPFPRRYPFYKDDSDVSDISSSEEEYMGDSGLHKLHWHQKGKCYWKQKLKKFSHKLFKALIKNNERLEDLNKDWQNINEVVDEMREEIEDENDEEDVYYEQLKNERLKLTTDIKKLRKELRNLKQH
jgi:hypothetical protein